MRYERKYRIENTTLAQLCQIVHMHPASFRERYPDRQINNIYLDTPQLTSFHQNIIGSNEREKYRIRWYGSEIEKITKPVFEIKIKRNKLGTKESTKLESFHYNELMETVKKLHLMNADWISLRPSLFNSYKRSYFISYDGRFRITIDHSLRYYPLLPYSNDLDFYLSDYALIMELKYTAKDDHLLDHITQWFPFRQQKHSKYVHGIQLCAGVNAGR